jgi:membrane-bound lytic murein transglycosylase B
MPTPLMHARRRLLMATSLGLAGGAGASARARATPRGPAPGPLYADHPVLDAFVDDTARRLQLPARWLMNRLAQARRSDAVRRLIMPASAGTAKNWRAYRQRFVEPDRIGAGVAFWRAHERWLQQAQARFGVPADIVLAIIGVETFYGRLMGSFRVIDALATLSFDFPSGRRDRSGFFRNELAEFFVWCAREGRDPLAPVGSYAGAMGLPQFMPSSINRYAVDFDGSGRIDLDASAADVVGSVARYLAEFGWKPGLPTHFAADPPAAAEDLAALRERDILPSFTAAQLAERGAALSEAARGHEGLLALVELENGGDAPSYVAGTTNFYAITRYNWSSYYAMAVIELAQALKEARQ